MIRLKTMTCILYQADPIQANKYILANVFVVSLPKTPSREVYEFKIDATGRLTASIARS